jgi:hypothetical protein
MLRLHAITSLDNCTLFSCVHDRGRDSPLKRSTFIGWWQLVVWKLGH